MATDPGAQSDAPRPRPRPSRSPRDASRMRRQNRRLEFLRRHPDYVTSSDREFVDVKLYNDLIRQFQTPAERMAEARDKGFAQVLEASILRNPERLERVGSEEEEEEEGENENVNENENENEDEDEEGFGHTNGQNGDSLLDGLANMGIDAYTGVDMDMDTALDVTAAAADTPRAAGQRAWQAAVQTWFVGGGAAADGFDYAAVDEDSDYDVLARADAEEAWFDGESPAWASEEGERALTGETGVQDF